MKIREEAGQSHSLSHSLIQSGLIDASLVRRGTEDAGDSWHDAKRVSSEIQADVGLNPGFTFYKPQALNKSFTKLWFAFLLLSQTVRNGRTSLIKLLGH